MPSEPQKPPALETILDHTGRVVIVTGSSRGIGAGIALRYAQAGADLVVHAHTNRAGGLRVVEQVRGLGKRAVLVEADLTDPQAVENLIKTAVSSFGRLDVLVNNAGIYPVQPFLALSLQDWQSTLDANLTSSFLCSRAAAEQMISQGTGGVITNLSSIEAQNPTPLHAHYCAAKAGVEQFSRTIAGELGRHNIRVNVVAPGLIWCEGLEQNWPDGVERWLANVPLGRLGMPEDVADACLFLSSQAARWISGATIVVDGGMLTSQVY